MYLHDFENHIHALILERGEDYYNEGAVSNLVRTKDGWKSVVSGSSDYDVSVEGHDEIKKWFCTCPHDHGPVCKHVAATLYAILDYREEENEEILESINDYQLREFVERQMLKSQSFTRAIEDYIKNRIITD